MAKIRTCPRFYACSGYASLEKLRSKLKVLRPGQHFPHYNSMGSFFVAMVTTVLNIFFSKICNQSPTPTILYIKFGQDWATGLGNILVWKCGRTDDGALLYYKFSIWVFGSGEVIINYRLSLLLVWFVNTEHIQYVLILGYWLKICNKSSDGILIHSTFLRRFQIRIWNYAKENHKILYSSMTSIFLNKSFPIKPVLQYISAYKQ